MKIKVKDILANPFRRIEKYTINEETVKFLMQSIEDVDFWSIVVRNHPTQKGKYEQAFGHHRIEAAKRLGLKEIEVQIVDLDNSKMIIAMANENVETNQSPSVINMTIEAIKDFLDCEFAKYDSWEEFRVNKSINPIFRLFESEPKFRTAKGQGVGQTTILKFLNGGRKEGQWKQWKIQQALDTLKLSKDNVIDREAIEEFETLSEAEKFKKAVVEEKIPKKQQKKLAKEIVNSGIGKRGIGEKVREAAVGKSYSEAKKKKVKEVIKGIPDIDEFVEKLANSCDSLASDLKKVIGFIDYVKSESVRNMYYGGLKRLKEVIEKSEKAGKKEITRSIDI
uniref:ParB-like N-terminal domain-containing protein n=1 Tax=viral metagenome TaxID=1070528 RepID=A0A6M3JL93_9ZZZZ